MSDEPKFVLNPFKYPSLTEPEGLLPRDMRAQACWYFYTIAQQAYESIGDSTEDQFGLLDDNLWMDKRYANQAMAVATLYKLESPDEFAKFWPFVEAQAEVLNLPAPRQEYMRLVKRFMA